MSYLEVRLLSLRKWVDEVANVVGELFSVGANIDESDLKIIVVSSLDRGLRSAAVPESVVLSIWEWNVKVGVSCAFLNALRLDIWLREMNFEAICRV